MQQWPDSFHKDAQAWALMRSLLVPDLLLLNSWQVGHVEGPQEVVCVAVNLQHKIQSVCNSAADSKAVDRHALHTSLQNHSGRDQVGRLTSIFSTLMADSSGM